MKTVQGLRFIVCAGILLMPMLAHAAPTADDCRQFAIEEAKYNSPNKNQVNQEAYLRLKALCTAYRATLPQSFGKGGLTRGTPAVARSKAPAVASVGLPPLTDNCKKYLLELDKYKDPNKVNQVNQEALIRYRELCNADKAKAGKP